MVFPRCYAATARERRSTSTRAWWTASSRSATRRPSSHSRSTWPTHPSRGPSWISTKSPRRIAGGLSRTKPSSVQRARTLATISSSTGMGVRPALTIASTPRAWRTASSASHGRKRAKRYPEKSGLITVRQQRRMTRSSLSRGKKTSGPNALTLSAATDSRHGFEWIANQFLCCQKFISREGAHLHLSKPKRAPAIREQDAGQFFDGARRPCREPLRSLRLMARQLLLGQSCPICRRTSRTRSARARR